MAKLLPESSEDQIQPSSSLSIDPLFTVEEVSAYLKVKPGTVRSMARAGKIPAIKMNRTWRFLKSQIDQFIKEHVSIA